MIYLASPYSHPDPAVREHRFDEACRAAAAFTKFGQYVFSPIAHSHPIAKHGAPTDWKFWEAYDRKFIEWCNLFGVLRLDGWQISVGVQAEIQIARELKKPVWYLDLHPAETFGLSGYLEDATQQTSFHGFNRIAGN